MLPSFVMNLRESSVSDTAGCMLEQLKHLTRSQQLQRRKKNALNAEFALKRHS